MRNGTTKAFLAPLVGDNPITLQILGICSALAVTKTVATALVMSVAVIFVLVAANTSVSLIRNHMPRNVRLIIQITIICSLVIVVDQVLRAFAYGLSKQLSVFVGLIVTNCIILGRAESFAMQNPVRLAVMDGLGNGFGYAWILLVVGAVRELFGSGSLLGVEILPTVANGGWFDPVALMLLPPSAFFIIGFLIWAIRAWQLAQAEAREFEERAATAEEVRAS
ncbi:MAG: NADH:ubiquinone reductase (Na(+)-transporting) subunit D [Alphaproteobacteria bacterium]|jgi:Na+-transporting NADH:ubiquinone oxidoreductase subunit D|nr:NADH:ubiquinone reductase (Na(+)-transporting) subunit D [Alphaproteobacteria bacterium]